MWATLAVLLLLLMLGGSLLLNLALIGTGASLGGEPRIQERHFSHERLAENKVAILHVEGTLLEGHGYVKRQIDQALKDDAVKAVVVRIDSPGGTVSASDFIYHYLHKLGKEKNIPIVVSMGAIAASGGYYVAMAVGPTPDTIFAEPTTWTGSIGVIIPHYDASALLAEWGVKQDSIVSHPLKGMGSFTRAMTDEERKILQGLVDESFAEFKSIIREGRPKFQKDPQALDRLATGQVYTARQAKENGLVDRIGYLEDAVDRAIQLTGLGADQVHVVEYKREFSLVDFLLGSQARGRAFDPAALVELAVPRAYYLWTWLPPAITSAVPRGRE
ncbi:MAG: signal peptide peptidase SppA [Thermoguttaceae bacterium]|nr:signal peptide peptidase SppA [Thermoguttaceae bacterium]